MSKKEKPEVKNNPNLPKKFKRKHMWWRYSLVFLGGMIFAVAGTLAGTAIYATTVPVSTITGYIPEEYRGLVDFIGDPESETLYSTVMKFVTKEITVDDITESISLADIIPSGMLSDNLYIKLCYYKSAAASANQNNTKLFQLQTSEKPAVPEGYEPITLYMLLNGKISQSDSTAFNFVNNLTSNLVISDILDETTIESSSLLKAIKDCSISNIQDTVMATPLSTLLGSTSGILASLGNLSINDLTADDAMEHIYVADILGVDENSDKMMQLIAFNKDASGNIDFNNKRSIADLSNLGTIVNTFTIGDIIDIDSSNKLLYALKDIQIGNLATEAESTIMNMKIKDLTTSTGGIMDSIGDLSMNDLMADDATSKLYVADILGVDENSDKMMQLIAFNKDASGNIDLNSKRTVADLSNLGTIIDGFLIDDIITIDTSDPILSALSGLKVSELASEAKNRVMGLTISELTGSTEGIMGAIGNLTVQELTEDGVKQKIAIADIMGASETSDNIIKLLCYEKNEDGTFNYNAKRTLADLDELQTIMNGFELGDVITIDDSDPLLSSLKDCTLGNLSSRLQNLKVSDVFPDSDNGFIKWLIEEDGDPVITKIDNEITEAPLGCLIDTSSLTGIAGGILGSLKDTAVGDLGSAFSNVKITSAFASEIYDEDGNITSTWKYLLYENVNAPTDSYKSYTLNDFSNLTTNMKNNMQYATIRMLVEDGFIASIEESKLNAVIPLSSNPKLVGDMTLSEFVTAVLG